MVTQENNLWSQENNLYFLGQNDTVFKILSRKTIWTTLWINTKLGGISIHSILKKNI